MEIPPIDPRSTRGIVLMPSGDVHYLDFATLEDYQHVVDGYITPITLSDGVVMLVNEEGLVRYGPKHDNLVARRVAVMGGAVQFTNEPLVGVAIVLGNGAEDFISAPEPAYGWVYEARHFLELSGDE